MQEIRRQIPYEEFDYQTLLHCLQGYARPRDKITGLLRSGKIVRVKKGLYIFGEKNRRGPFSREVLANLIFGPSYISLEFAMHFHGLIPERVEAITSVTSRRSHRFVTAVGLFTYWGISLAAFQNGMDQYQTSDGRHFLMASPEKALCDKIQQERGTTGSEPEELAHYLSDQLRIERAALLGLDPNRIAETAAAYRSRKLLALAGWIRQTRSEPHE